MCAYVSFVLILTDNVKKKVYNMTSPDDLALRRAREDGATCTQERQSPVTIRASPVRFLAERQLDRPRALSSRWVSV